MLPFDMLIELFDMINQFPMYEIYLILEILHMLPLDMLNELFVMIINPLCIGNLTHVTP